MTGLMVEVAEGAVLTRRHRRETPTPAARFPLLAAIAAGEGPLAVEAAAVLAGLPVTDVEIAEALEHVWSDHCGDTGCIPPNFTIHGPSTTRVSAKFAGTDFAYWVAEWINAGRRRKGS